MRVDRNDLGRAELREVSGEKLIAAPEIVDPLAGDGLLESLSLLGVELTVGHAT